MKKKNRYKEIREANIEEQGRLINRYLISNPDEIRNLRSGGLIIIDSKLSLWFDEGLLRLQTPSLPKDEIKIKDMSTTILFADVISSTQLADILPDDMYYQFFARV
jgi:hypothetical protein